MVICLKKCSYRSTELSLPALLAKFDRHTDPGTYSGGVKGLRPPQTELSRGSHAPDYTSRFTTLINFLNIATQTQEVNLHNPTEPTHTHANTNKQILTPRTHN